MIQFLRGIGRVIGNIRALAREGNRILQQRHLRIEWFSRLSCQRAGLLVRERRTALVDSAVDYGKVLLQHRERLRIERRLLRVGKLLQSGDRVR